MFILLPVHPGYPGNEDVHVRASSISAVWDVEGGAAVDTPTHVFYTTLSADMVLSRIAQAEAAERSAAMPDLGSILSTALGGVGDDA